MPSGYGSDIPKDIPEDIRDVEQLRATAMAVAQQVGDFILRMRVKAPGK